MTKLLKDIQKIVDNISNGNFNQNDVVSFIFSIGITLVFFISYHFWGNYVVEAMGITAGIAWGVLILLIMLVAGFTVLKSLFLFAAELSLLIFLAQSFCSVTQRSTASNEAMKNLLFVGLLYIIFMVSRSLCKNLKEYYKRVENERWSIAKIFTISLFLIFIVWFSCEIYQVVNPIIRDLCVRI